MSGTLLVHRPVGVAQAVALMREQPHAQLVGGGTELVTLTRSGLMPQAPLLSVRSLGLDGVSLRHDQLVLGAGACMADVARSPLVTREAPTVAQALLASASPQVRNVATLGGNLLQRTRCSYFRGDAPNCNKLTPGSGCAVSAGGDQRQAAIFGASPACCATHASDLAVALLALDAVVVVNGPLGERRMALDMLHVEPAGDATQEHSLAPGELITAIEVPCTPAARRARYLKVRDRASFQFALVSVAVALQCVDGVVTHARVAAGGVGTRPWRLRSSEAELLGRATTASTWQRAGAAAEVGAEPLPGAGYKLELLQRCVTQVLTQVHVETRTPIAGDMA